MIIRKPEQEDIKGLINLSKKFSRQYKWAENIPVGRINTYCKAEDWLFGESIYRVLIACTKDKTIGYLGINEFKEGYEASILVDPEYQGQGVGRKLTDQVFKEIPEQVEVEAWVADFNKKSLDITPKLGFKLKRKFKEKNFIPDEEFTVYIFARRGDGETRDTI